MAAIQLEYWFQGPLEGAPMFAQRDPDQFFAARCEWATTGRAPGRAWRLLLPWRAWRLHQWQGMYATSGRSRGPLHRATLPIATGR